MKTKVNFVILMFERMDEIDWGGMTGLIKDGYRYFTPIDAGTDQYVVVVTKHKVTEQVALALYEKEQTCYFE